MKHRWIGRVAAPPIDLDELAELVAGVLPNVDPGTLEPLTGGFRNHNFRVGPADAEQVLRIYAAGDLSAFKERRLAELLHGRIRCPEYTSVELVGDRVVALRRFEAGQPLHECLDDGSMATAYWGRRIGTALGRIHAVAFSAHGEFDATLTITEPYDLSATGLVQTLRNLLGSATARERLGPALVEGMIEVTCRASESLAAWSSRPTLIHSDFGPTNLIATVDGELSIIDWEFACSALVAFDFGNLLRPPLETADEFAAGLREGYEAEGHTLPEDWRALARVADLYAWAQFAARPHSHALVIDDARQRIRHTLESFTQA